MTIKSNIIDGLGRRNHVEVSNNNTLKVSTLEYYNYLNEIRYFVNPIHGFNMNINSSSNLDELVHNGTDDIAWTGSTISGTSVTFDSTTDPLSGSKHIYGNSLVNDTVFQLKRGSNINTSDYIDLVGYMNLLVLGNPTAEFYVSGYNTSTSQQVGIEVSIFDYINTGDIGVYQPFVIPLSDMELGSSTIDSFRFRVELLSGTMSFYLDNIYLTSLGAGEGSQTFTLQPNKDEILVVDCLNWLIVDDYDGITGQNGLMKLEYDKILGETLLYGITYQRYLEDNVLFSITLKNITDWITEPHTIIRNYSSDGTNTIMNIHYKFYEPYVMTDKDKIIQEVNDNMSGFINFRSSANCKKIIGSTGNDYQLSNGYKRVLSSYGK